MSKVKDQSKMIPIESICINTLIDLLNIIFITVYMFILNARLAAIILTGLPVLGGIVFLLKTAQKKANFVYQNKNSNLTAYTCESIEGVKVSQIFDRQQENMEIYNKLNKSYQKAWYKMAYLNNILVPVTENIQQIVLSLVYIAGILWISPTIEVGVLLAMATYASRFWQPILSLANIYNNFINAISYLERIFQTIDEPVDIMDSEMAKPLENMQGDVEFCNVTFEYDKGSPVLCDTSFHISKGESVALVGPTGSGKTTIVNLISRFYNVTRGEVYIDGHNISDLTIHSVRSQMGIMLQDSFIFSGTIADNVRYGKLHATMEEIIKACTAVCADEFIQNLPDGYETVVSERGGTLSQGQKQLIAFARTLLANPAIIILDEATSSIDAKTEKLLQKGVETLLNGRTSIIIAHRLSTIRYCDKIMFIDGGEILESGNHDELMEKKGHYYELHPSESALRMNYIWYNMFKH